MKKAISILGPTHCGKTELAIEINEHFPTKIISVDSVQVYKGANIGSSKPNQKILDSIHPVSYTHLTLPTTNSV